MAKTTSNKLCYCEKKQRIIYHGDKLTFKHILFHNYLVSEHEMKMKNGM